MAEEQTQAPAPDESAAPDLIQIKERWTGAVIFEIAAVAELTGAKFGARIGFAARKAIEDRANLTDANLTGANLTDASLTDASLTDADLRGANLTDANLTGANLTGARLRGANLTGANLTGASLTDADLTGANLTGANLTGARLRGADLKSWNLTKARRLAAGPALRDALATVVALLPESGDEAVVAARKLLEQVP